jgi:four helix bundle protein
MLSKLTDADAELQETVHWLATALACGYVSGDQHGALLDQTADVGRMLGVMLKEHESFCHPP